MVDVTVKPLTVCPTCDCAGDCNSCIQKASCGWNGSACVSGTRSGPGNTAACQPDNWNWNSCSVNQASQCVAPSSPQAGDCSITKNSTTPASVSLTAQAPGFTDNTTTRFDWYVDPANASDLTNFAGTNKISDQPSGFSGFAPNTNHTIYAKAWSTTGTPVITRACSINFTTNSVAAKYKCVNNACTRDDNATGTTYNTSSCSGACAPAPSPVTSCTCNADNPSCGETTTGVCLGTNIPCSRNGPACVNDARIVFNFYNEDCVTPYSGTATIKLLEDDQNGNNHNDLFYGPNGTGSHNTNQEVRACDTPEWHPYMDPGYQINSDGTLSGCPGQNMDNCCTGPSGECSEVEGYSCTPDRFSESCTPGCDPTRACRGDYCCGTCYVNRPNDTCLGAGSTPNEPTTWPRCFSPASSHHQDITAGYPNNTFTYSAGYFNMGQGNQLAPRDQMRTYSIGAPQGYQLKVNQLCSGGYDGGCNAGVLQGLKNQGRTVKNFNSATTASLTNYWASPYERVEGNTSILAYDVCVKIPTVTLSGVVFNDKNKDTNRNSNTSSSAYEEGLPNTVVSITSPTPQSAPQVSPPTDSTGSYLFTNLQAGRYSLTFTPPQGYSTTTQIPVNLTLNSDTIKDLGASTVYIISGTVRNDDNGDGICLPSESALPNTRVTLTNGPTQKPPTSTSGSGSYSFTNLQTGTYTVSLNPGPNKKIPAPQTVAVGPDALGTNFCIATIPPWLQTVGGDIHSNTNVKLPKGPPQSPGP